jgi:hypothetical protein
LWRFILRDLLTFISQKESKGESERHKKAPAEIFISFVHIFSINKINNAGVVADPFIDPSCKIQKKRKQKSFTKSKKHNVDPKK